MLRHTKPCRSWSNYQTRQEKWDNDFFIDENIDTALNILKDEKPTAVRQALAAVMDIVRYKQDLREVVKKAVSEIAYLRYKETMHSLLAKDITAALNLIRALDNSTDIYGRCK